MLSDEFFNFLCWVIFVKPPCSCKMFGLAPVGQNSVGMLTVFLPKYPREIHLCLLMIFHWNSYFNSFLIDPELLHLSFILLLIQCSTKPKSMVSICNLKVFSSLFVLKQNFWHRDLCFMVQMPFDILLSIEYIGFFFEALCPNTSSFRGLAI